MPRSRNDRSPLPALNQFSISTTDDFFGVPLAPVLILKVHPLLAEVVHLDSGHFVASRRSELNAGMNRVLRDLVVWFSPLESGGQGRS
jgi:hypothetical protein